MSLTYVSLSRKAGSQPAAVGGSSFWISLWKRGTDDFPTQLHERRRQKRLGRQSFGVTGIGGARRPLPEREQERPRLSATELRRPRAKWPCPPRRSTRPPPRRTHHRPLRAKPPPSRFPT